MVLGRYKYILIILSLLVTNVAFSETSQQLELKYLSERYKDFYIHENNKKRRDQERKEGAEAQRLYRLKLKAEREKSRLAFVKKVKQKEKIN